MDKITIIKYALMFILLVISIAAFQSGNAIVGLLGVFAFMASVYLHFLKPFIKKVMLTKKEMINILLDTLEADYKMSVSRDLFELYWDAPDGDLHRFVFMSKDEDSTTWYYLCTIEIYTGRIGAMTGRRTDRINEAEFFMYGERKAKPRAEISPELLEEFTENMKSTIREEIDRAGVKESKEEETTGA